MGLLDNTDDPTMALAMGLLGAGGYSRMPVSTGQGMAAGIGAYQQAKQQQQEMGMRSEMFGLQKQQHQMQLDQMKRAQAEHEAAKANLQSYVSQMPDGPQKQQIIQAVQMGVPMTEVWKKLNPEAKLETIFTPEGREQKAWTAPGQDVVPVGGAKAIPLHFANTGNAIVGVDPVTGRPVGQGLQVQVSPDARLSAGTAMRGQNLTDARARENLSFQQGQANKPQFNADAGGWITPPAGMPQGSTLKVPGLEPKITESQGKAGVFGSRAENAHAVLNRLEEGINRPGLAAKQGVEGVYGIGGGLGVIGNSMLSADQQKVDQAQRDFVNSVLRLESGAAISPTEFDSARKQYFPQPGDTPEVVAQKRANREAEINGLKVMAGPASALIKSRSSAVSPGGWSASVIK